jgi:hypothetical protein
MSEELDKTAKVVKEYIDALYDTDDDEDYSVDIQEEKDPWWESLWFVIPIFPIIYIIQELKSLKRYPNNAKDEDVFELWFQFLGLAVLWLMSYFGIAMLIYHMITNPVVLVTTCSIIVAILLFIVIPIKLINWYIKK